MRIAVIGAKGQVGWELARRAPLLGHEALAWDMAELDITDAVAVDRALAVSGADAVINAAAYTAVDKAEQEPELAFAVNRDGPAHLAAACNRLHIPLLHISTDYVYDGNKPNPYVEDDPVAPLGVYGQSKAEGDDAVLRLLPRHLILRVSWVFGIHGHNFVKTMLRLAQEREELRVVADQFGCPTYAGDIADTLLELAGRTAEIDASGAWGTYHYCGRQRPLGTVLPVRSLNRHRLLKSCECRPSPRLPLPTILRPLPVRPIRCWTVPGWRSALGFSRVGGAMGCTLCW